MPKERQGWDASTGDLTPGPRCAAQGLRRLLRRTPLQQLRATLMPHESRVLEGRSNQTEAALRHPGARRHPPPTNLSPQDQAWVCGPSESTGAAAPQAGTHHRW